MSVANQNNTHASIKNLETQMSQLAKQIAYQSSGGFKANTQTNPKKHSNVVGKVKVEKVVEKGHGTEKQKKGESCLIVILQDLSKKKEEDPSEITLHVTVSDIKIENALINLSASVKVIISNFKLEPTIVSLQMANKSMCLGQNRQTPIFSGLYGNGHQGRH